jgi:hypothetical protein
MINENSLFNAMLEAMQTHSGTATNINWNNGVSVRCFLFNGIWFPLRATINHARRLHGEPNDQAITTVCESDLIKVLSPLQPFIKDISIVANQLPIATFSDEIEGRKRKWDALNAHKVREQLIQGYA